MMGLSYVWVVLLKKIGEEDGGMGTTRNRKGVFICYMQY